MQKLVNKIAIIALLIGVVAVVVPTQAEASELPKTSRSKANPP